MQSKDKVIPVTETLLGEMESYNKCSLGITELITAIKKYITDSCLILELNTMAEILIGQVAKIEEETGKLMGLEERVEVLTHAAFQIIRRHYTITRDNLIGKDRDDITNVFSKFISTYQSTVGKNNMFLAIDCLEYDVDVDTLENSLQNSKIEMITVSMSVDEIPEREMEILKDVLNTARLEQERLETNLNDSLALLSLVEID